MIIIGDYRAIIRDQTVSYHMTAIDQPNFRRQCREALSRGTSGTLPKKIPQSII